MYRHLLPVGHSGSAAPCPFVGARLFEWLSERHPKPAARQRAASEFERADPSPDPLPQGEGAFGPDLRLFATPFPQWVG